MSTDLSCPPLAPCTHIKLIFPAAILGDLWLSPHIASPYSIASSTSTSLSLYSTHLPIRRLAGYIIFICGSSLRYWSMRTLGKYFTFHLSIRSEHKIIRSGPYSVVRNPSYTGLHFMVFGFAMILQNGNALNVVSLVLQLIIGAFLTWIVLPVIWTIPRLRNEEKMLADHFGNDWEAYRREVPYRIIPLVW